MGSSSRPASAMTRAVANHPLLRRRRRGQRRRWGRPSRPRGENADHHKRGTHGHASNEHRQLPPACVCADALAADLRCTRGHWPRGRPLAHREQRRHRQAQQRAGGWPTGHPRPPQGRGTPARGPPARVPEPRRTSVPRTGPHHGAPRGRQEGEPSDPPQPPAPVTGRAARRLSGRTTQAPKGKGGVPRLRLGP